MNLTSAEYFGILAYRPWVWAGHTTHATTSPPARTVKTALKPSRQFGLRSCYVDLTSSALLGLVHPMVLEGCRVSHRHLHHAHRPVLPTVSRKMRQSFTEFHTISTRTALINTSYGARNFDKIWSHCGEHELLDTELKINTYTSNYMYNFTHNVL